MTGHNPVAGAPSAARPVSVWDLPLRLSHWLLAGSVLTAWFTANIYDTVHEIAGYTALGVLVFRLVWGFVGGRHSRFRNFVRSPAATMHYFGHYFGELARGRHARSLGLNPAGAAMALALLALIAIATVSGWMQITVAFFGVAWVEQVHSWSSNLVLILVVLHVVGVLLMCALQRENLVRAMIDGRKRGDEGEPKS